MEGYIYFPKRSMSKAFSVLLVLAFFLALTHNYSTYTSTFSTNIVTTNVAGTSTGFTSFDYPATYPLG